MSLLQPAALLWFALVAALLFLSRRRRTGRRLVSNLYLWRAAPRPDALQLRRRRSTHNLLVALQIAILASMILALARPAFEVGRRDIALILDVSASMGASHGTGTRLDAAKVQALGIVDGLAASTQVRIIAAAAAPIDLGVFHAGDPRLRLALSRLEPTAGGAAIEASIERVMATAERGTPLYILSDTAARSRQSPEKNRIHWVLSGTEAGNLAISALAIRSLPEQPDRLQVLTTIRNYSGVPRDVDVEWSADGRPFERRRVHIAPGAAASVTLPLNGQEQTLAARLLTKDALDIDNQRFAVVPEGRLLRVQLITNGNRFLESALRADSRVSLDVVPTSSVSGNASTPFDVVVCDACERIPSAAIPTLLVGLPSASSSAFRLKAEPTSAPSTPTTPHPVVAGLQLDNVPLAVREDGTRRIVELGVDLQNSTLPLSVDFPLLVSNALTWLSASEENAGSVIAGSPLRWRIAAPLGDSAAVTAPDGSTVQPLVQGAELVVLDTGRVGRYDVRVGSGLVGRFVANPLVDGESDLRAAPTPTRPPDLESVTAARTVSAVPFLLVAGLLLLTAEWWYRRTLSQTHRSVAAGSLLCRLAVAAAMIVSLAGLRIRAGEAPLTVAFIVDRSDSVSPRTQVEHAARVDEMARARRSEDRAGLVAFAGDAAVERTPTDRFSMPGSFSTLSTASTNIENAVDTALAQLQASSGGRIVLFSDGRETSGDVVRAAAAAAAARVPIDVALPISESAAKAPVSILRVAAPPEARTNEPYLISIEVEGPAGGSGEIRIDRSSNAPLITRVTFDEHGAGRVTMTERQASTGLYSYGVTAITEDDRSAPAAGRAPDAGAIVAVHGQPHALYVSDAGSPFAARLRGAGFQTTLAAADTMPRSAEALNAYDLIVVDDVPLEALPESAAAALAAHVNAAAGGLLVMGSANSLSPATVRSPLAAAIPIDLRPRSGRRSPPASIVIVFDKSGSMADTADGIAKIELARQAVLGVLDVVPSTDEIGVIAFSQSAETVAPLHARHDPRELAARLRALPPSGATAIAPAIEAAIGWLRDPSMASAVRRHIVLISDGRTSAADAARVRSAAAGKGIEISVIALGESADRAFLEDVARISGGRAFFPGDLRQLPILVAREAARVASGWRFDGPFQPKTTSHPLSANVPALPTLHGYVVSAAKQDAESIVLSHLDDPVLAAWRFGLGRVAVFTSDIRTAGGTGEAQALGAVWVSTARWVTRQAGDSDLSLTATQKDDGVHLAVEAGDDRGFLDGLAVTADVRSTGGTHQRVTLEQSAPGRYEAVVALESPGPYTATIVAAGTPERRLLRGFYRTSPEVRARGVDTTLLARIASMTGGRLLAHGDNPFTGARQPGVVDLPPWLLTAALLLFFFEVTRGRRVAVSTGVRQWLQTITARRAPRRAT